MRIAGMLFISLGVLLSNGCKKSTDATGGKDGQKKLTIALLPKSKGNQFFVTCEKGARQAADEIGAELLFDGPTNNDPAKQNEIVENWITLGVDVIAAASQSKEGISTTLKKARAKGITVVTYDSDANADARSFFINQATPGASASCLWIRRRNSAVRKATSPSSPGRSRRGTSTPGAASSRRGWRRSIRR